MAALGNATTMSVEDICTILDLHTDNRIVRKVPPSTAEAGRDKDTDLSHKVANLVEKE